MADYPLLCFLIDTTYPHVPATHAHHLQELNAILDQIQKNGLDGMPKVQMMIVSCGGAPPHHSYATRVWLQTEVMDHIRKELAALKFAGGGFGSCLWDGVAQCIALLKSSLSSRKYLCIVPSSIPESNTVRFFKGALRQNSDALALALVQQGVRVSVLTCVPIPELEDLYSRCLREKDKQICSMDPSQGKCLAHCLRQHITCP